MNLTTHVIERGRASPHADALIGPQGPLPYGHLAHLIRTTTTWLAEVGIAEGATVGIKIAHPIEHMIISLALAHRGATQVSFAPDTPELQERAFAERAGVTAVVAGNAPVSGANLPVVHFDLARMSHPAAPIDERVHCPKPLAPFIFVLGSGTTGTPKLIALSHELYFQRLLMVPHSSIAAADKVLSFMQVHYLSGKMVAWAALVRGAAAVFAPPAELVDRFEAIVNRYEIAYVRATPIHARQLLDRATRPLSVPSIRLFGISSARVDPPLRRGVAERITPRLTVAYGTNETAIVSAALPPIALQVPTCVGAPLEGIKLEIVDDNDRVLGPGQPGNIRMRSPWGVTGYLGDDAATARFFRNGWFCPGDLGEFTSQGLLIHHGRADDMMLYDGINIFPGEIEQVLLEHPAVSEAAAFPIKSERHHQIPAAAVVLRFPAELREISEFARQRLGVRTPRIISPCDRLPRTSTGKVLKSQLAEELMRRFPPPP